MNYKSRVICIFLLSFIFNVGLGQSSMMGEVSYPVLEKLIQIAKENYPRVKAFQKEIDIAEANFSKTKKSWLDVLNLAYMKTDNLGATNKESYMLNGYQYGININIGSLIQKPAQIKVAKESIEIAWLKKKEYEKLIEKKVKEYYFTYIQKLTTLKLKMKKMQDAESVSKTVLYKFEKGQETYEQYSKALTTYNEQAEEIIEVEAEMLIAKANLEELTGVKMEEVQYWESAKK